MGPSRTNAVLSQARALVRRTGFDVHRVRPPAVEVGTAPTAPTSFYVPSPSCQVPYLAFIYELYFGRRTDGMFVEVGAFDGYSYSNTSCLVEVGWSGLYIEPVPTNAARCRARYDTNPRVEVHEIAIGAADGEVTIHVGGELSTIDQATFAEYQDITWAKPSFDSDDSDDSSDSAAKPAPPATVTVAQTTLDQFLEARSVAPGFEVLVVDVEGFETSVFAGFDLERWRPAMLIVELTDTHPDLESSRNAHGWLGHDIGAAGYTIAFKDVINTIFVRDEVWESTYPRPGAS